MKIRIILLIFSCLISVASFGQSDFRKGFIIKNDGDTVIGLIDYRGGILMSEICRFKKDENSPEMKYTPEDISAFRFLESKYFISKEYKGEKKFYEFLINGQISMYFMKDKDGDHYFLEKAEAGLQKIPYNQKVMKIEDKTYSGISTEHIGFLNVHMQDAEGFYPKISKIKRISQKNLINLAEDYHKNVCNDNGCLIYSKTPPRLKMNPEIVAGVVNYKNELLIRNSQYFQKGIITHIWFPQYNEKFFIRMGILHSNVDSYMQHEVLVGGYWYTIYRLKNQNLYKIPIVLEYMFPRGIVRPRIGYGVHLNKITEQQGLYTSFAFMGGANIHITKGIALTLNYDYEFTSKRIPLIPQRNISNSFFSGILFRI